MAKVVDKRFTFMESYLRSINMITDPSMKLDFLMKVLNYGLYLEYPKFNNDFARGHFEEIRSHIDLSLHQREINSINGSKAKGVSKESLKGNQNARKNFDETKQNKAKQNEIKKTKAIEYNIIESNITESNKNNIYKDLPRILVMNLEEFEKMRKQIKKPLTDRARETIVKKLQEFTNGDIDKQIQIIDRSIINCWKDVYPLEDNRNYKSYRNFRNSNSLSVGDMIGTENNND